MRPMLAQLVLSLLPLAAPLSAQQVARSAIADLAVDRSCGLENAKHIARGDLRDNIALFGQRPTLVVFPSRIQWLEAKEDEYVRAFKKVDKYVGKWRRQGFDIVMVMPQASVSKAGSKRPHQLELARRVKAKNCIAAEANYILGHPDDTGIVAGLLMNVGNTKDLEFRWALLSELGVIKRAGDNVFDEALSNQFKQVAVSTLANNAATKRVFAAINQWRLGDAETLILKMKATPAGAKHADSLTQLETMLATAETHYRKVFAGQYKARGYLPEYANELENLARRYMAGTARGGDILAQVEQVRAAGEFAAVNSQHEAFNALARACEDANAKVEVAYNKDYGQRPGYDEVLYNKKILEFYPPAIKAMSEFVRNQRTSPYYKEAAIMFMEAKESVADAKQIVASGE